MQDLVAFASRFNLSPSQAVVLPALFDNAAVKCNMPSEQLVVEATYHNKALGEYLASVAVIVAEEVEV